MGFDLNKNELLEIHLKEGKRFLERLKKARRFLSKAPQKILGYTGKSKTIIVLSKQIFQFMTNTTKIYDIKLKEPKLFDETESIDNVYAYLSIEQDTLNFLVDVLEIKLRPKLNINDIKFLQGLRGDLESLGKETLPEIILKNLEKAIEELEESDYFPCSVISSRVTLWMLDKIKGEDEKKGEDKDESKVRKLVKLGIIDKEEISKQTQKSFLEMARSARNFILHDISAFPNCAEAHKFLSSALIMAKLYLEYIKKSSNM